MKKIINGKVYDIETAKFIAKYHSDLMPFDLCYLEESLYLKRTGEYFLLGYGGPMTCYTRKINGEWNWGEKIKPLTYEEAQKWVEDHLSPEEYERIFSKISDNNGRTVLSISVPTPIADLARKAAQSKSMTLSEYIAHLIDRDN